MKESPGREIGGDRAEVEKTKISNEGSGLENEERRRKQKERMRRSSKGQPIMDDTVRRLLSTIQKKEGWRYENTFVPILPLVKHCSIM